MSNRAPAGRMIAGIAMSMAAGAGVSALVSVLAGARARRLVPMDGTIVDIGGTPIHYLDRGCGPPIVMIHGLGGQLRNFSYALSGRLVDRHRVVLIDRPGSGYSGRMPGRGGSLADQAAAVAALIAKLGLDRPLIVGHSLGGAVALALALDHAASVGALALIAPLTAPPRGVPAAVTSPALRLCAVRRVIGHAVVPAVMLLSGRRRDLVFAPEPVPPDVETGAGLALLWQGDALAGAAADIRAAVTEMPLLAARYGELTMSVALLFGRGDRVLDPGEHGAGAAARIPAAELTLCDGGHMLPLTQPALVADWIEAAQARLQERGQQ